jgi:hypothetical protein
MVIFPLLDAKPMTTFDVLAEEVVRVLGTSIVV